MTSFYAKSSFSKTDPMDVVFVIYPDIVLLDLVGPLQVFTHSRRNPQSKNAYRTHVISNSGGQINTNTILPIDSTPLSEWIDRPIHTLVFIGGDGAIDASLDQTFLMKAKQLASQSTRVCSVCSGALVIAAAGLLDGKRAVTHWEDCDMLAKQNPAVKVEIDPIYIKDGNIWTSAGITAGIDMSLAIIEEDLGKPAAIEMARSLVTPMVRSGGQSQFSPELDRQSKDADGRYADLHDWIKDNLKRKISVDDMAEFCAMSSRNFSRQYTSAMGTSPAKALEALRVDTARTLLTSTTQSIKSVARESGFLDDERMRRAFLRHINTSPTAYRNQFLKQENSHA